MTRLVFLLLFWFVTSCVSALNFSQVEQAIPKLESYIHAALNQTGVPGVSIAIVFQDEVVYLNGFGVREVGGNLSVTADTVFQLASMSKPISSTIVGALVTGGYVTWDDSANNLDPIVQLSDPWITREVTLRDLFSHRSGLYGDAGNDLENFGFDRDTILSRLRYLNPGGPFRASYAYSNFGMTAGGVAAATAAGQSWEMAAQEKLYGPLGMSSTSSSYADFVSRQNRAHLHILQNDTWILGPVRNADAQSPAGGASSSARDLAQWIRLQLGNGTVDGKLVVDATVLEDTHQPVINRGINPLTGKPSFYALGWNYYIDEFGRSYIDHAGAFSRGARTIVQISLDENLGITVLSNAFPTGVPDAISYTFFDYVHTGEQSRDWLTFWNGVFNGLAEGLTSGGAPYAQPVASPSPALADSAYIGVYTNSYVGNATVTSGNGGLSLHLGPQGNVTFALSHWNRDTFLYYPDPETPDVPVGVVFLVGPDGMAAQVVIANFNGDGQGVLTRVATS